MNSVNMLVLNGIDSGEDFTFLHPNGGRSIIDYIILSDDFFFPDCKLAVQNTDTRSGSVVNVSSFPLDSRYEHQSVKVFTNPHYIISDHLLVTCKLKCTLSTLPVPALPSDPLPISSSFEQGGEDVKITKWDRRDGGDPQFWAPMQTELEKYLQDWFDQDFAPGLLSIDKLLQGFVDAVNVALSLSLKVRRSKSSTQRTLFWHNDVFPLRCKERAAHKDYLSASLKDKDAKLA